MSIKQVKSSKTEKCVMKFIPKKNKFNIVNSKILTKIVHKRITRKTKENLTKDQYGFRRNRKTREILRIKLIIEKL